jgi:transposase InsO family protein
MCGTPRPLRDLPVFAVAIVDGSRTTFRTAGLLGSKGTLGDCFDALAESFFATVGTEPLDRTTWPTRAGLACALFDYIERFYSPNRRHSSPG